MSGPRFIWVENALVNLTNVNRIELRKNQIWFYHVNGVWSACYFKTEKETLVDCREVVELLKKNRLLLNQK